VIRSDDQNRTTASLGCNSPQDMAMGMMYVEDIKLFTTKIARNVEDVPKIIPEKLGMINPDRMVQTKLIRRRRARKPNPFLYAILNWKRRFLISQGDLMPSLF
jgi:hypothetical protein